MGKLTKAQEKFVNEVVSGKSQREAYKIAYPHSKKWKDSSIDTSASRLLNSAKVAPRYQELSKEVTESLKQDTIASKQEVLEFFTKMMRQELKDEMVSSVSRKKVSYDEEGRRVEESTRDPKVVEVKTKSGDAFKGAEALAKHWGVLTAQDVNDEELTKVDELLNAMKVGVSDED